VSSLYLDEAVALDAIAPGDTVTVSGDEARHAVSVARVRVGERLAVGDGRGTIAYGAVTRTEPRELELLVDETVVIERPAPAITLVQALAKGDRDELAVQAATELGVDRVVPWQAARSVSRWEGPKAAKGRQRWQSIAREATKQSIRAWLPGVDDVSPTSGLPERLAGSRVLLLEPSADIRLTELTFDDRDLALVVGPEGGIAPDELERLGAAGAEAVRLGASVLRTSTAGPAAIAVISAALGRW
jgi:16S rRNA (uracil1498-N3)-methyltransferase